jgi:hypothetical protein
LSKEKRMQGLCGRMERRKLYGAWRYVLPWEAPDGQVYAVHLDERGVDEVCRQAKMNKSRSARVGPVSVRLFRGRFVPGDTRPYMERFQPAESYGSTERQEDRERAHKGLMARMARNREA